MSSDTAEHRAADADGAPVIAEECVPRRLERRLLLAFGALSGVIVLAFGLVVPLVVTFTEDLVFERQVRRQVEELAANPAAELPVDFRRYDRPADLPSVLRGAGTLPVGGNDIELDPGRMADVFLAVFAVSGDSTRRYLLYDTSAVEAFERGVTARYDLVMSLGLLVALGAIVAGWWLTRSLRSGLRRLGRLSVVPIQDARELAQHFGEDELGGIARESLWARQRMAKHWTGNSALLSLPATNSVRRSPSRVGPPSSFGSGWVPRMVAFTSSCSASSLRTGKWRSW